jgi:hypothetical protein
MHLVRSTVPAGGGRSPLSLAMSFRRKQNRHDQWLSYCQSHESVLHATGLPAELFRRAEVFEDFLRHGSFRDTAGSEAFLSKIPDTAFLTLEEFINGYFDFQDSYPTLQQERFRRFQRYG